MQRRPERILAGVTRAFFALLLLLVPALLPADRVVLKNGTVIEGTIVNSDGAIVEIVSGGIKQTHYMTNVERIERDDEGDAASPGLPAAREALQLHTAGNYSGAWRQWLQMDAADPEAWQEYADTIRATVTRLTGRQNSAVTQALQAGEAQQVLDVVALFQSDESERLVAKVFPESTTDFRTRIRELAGQGLFVQGRSARLAGNFEEARESLEDALANLAPGMPGYTETLFNLGLVRLDIARQRWQATGGQLSQSQAEALEQLLLDAQSNLNAARDAAGTAGGSGREILMQTEDALRALGGLRDSVEERLRVFAPQPTPTATPIPTPTPTPEPTPSPTPSRMEELVGSQRMEGIRSFVGGILPAGTDTDQVLDWAIYAAVFLVIFWIIPWAIFKILRKRIDPIAEQWAPRVKFLGPIALIGYMVSFVAARPKRIRIKKSKNPCPHCGFALDDMLAYQNLDFFHCPNCGGEIDPVFSIEDYITFLSNSLATDAEKVTLGIVSMASFVEKDVMQKLVNAIITNSIRSRASDVHIEPQQQAVSIRHRIDGVMTEMTRLPASIGPAIVSAIKVMASMDISEKRKPQDGATSVMVDENSIDLRVASSPSTVGETVTIRILDFRSIQMETKNLGMTKSGRELFERAIREPHGLILVTGPTGSGKTTSLYVALQSIATGDKNIISIEDPIEFRLPGINQMQVNPNAGLTFATGLRSILRQDPDVIMVGEIRDKETAEIAVHAAQTGHLVFSTLHTIDASATVTRLYDLGISPRQFTDAMSLIVAQRLIRLVCPDCKKPDKPDKSVLREIGVDEADEPEYEFVIGKGCATCNNMGYLGRSGIFEIMAPNSAIRAALEKGDMTTQQLRELAIANGMRTLREEALVLLRQGMTTAEEVLRVTK